MEDKNGVVWTRKTLSGGDTTMKELASTTVTYRLMLQEPDPITRDELTNSYDPDGNERRACLKVDMLEYENKLLRQHIRRLSA